jgi:hypothetical protein
MKKYSLLILSLIVLCAFGCKKETPTEPIKLGGFYQGGYIFYLDNTGQHGMVMAPVEMEKTLAWGCTGTLLDVGGGVPNFYGWGAYCTSRMVLKCSEANTAGSYCYYLENGGYTDWFLPTPHEWNKAYILLGDNATVNLKANSHYWVGYEADASRAGYCNSTNLTGTIFETKTAMNLVRPVRSF